MHTKISLNQVVGVFVAVRLVARCLPNVITYNSLDGTTSERALVEERGLLLFQKTKKKWRQNEEGPQDLKFVGYRNLPWSIFNTNAALRLNKASIKWAFCIREWIWEENYGESFWWASLTVFNKLNKIILYDFPPNVHFEMLLTNGGTIFWKNIHVTLWHRVVPTHILWLLAKFLVE